MGSVDTETREKQSMNKRKLNIDFNPKSKRIIKATAQTILINENEEDDEANHEEGKTPNAQFISICPTFQCKN